MISTANLTELQTVVEASCGDPHHILGLHETEVFGKKCLAARAFIPGAKAVYLLDPKKPSFREELEKIHDDGFFEKVIKRRRKWFRYEFEAEDFKGNKWIMSDPYSFPPVLSDMDLHLFGEGTHMEIYEKLGAHLMTIDGVKGALFAVWAPNAFRVSVIGDFNNWDGRRNQMRLLANSGVWELFVPGIKNFERYKFEIKTFSGEIMEKSDPYGNFFELRPSKSTLVFDIGGYKWNDSEWMEKRKRRNLLKEPVNIYEVHLGSWKKSEDETQGDGCFLSYSELAEDLIPYVVEMGYTHIELLPVQEHPNDASWGYRTTGYYAPTSRHGTPPEFMEFIDKCHLNGIGVIIDWVPAHFPKDRNGLARFDGSALYEHEDPKQGEHPDRGTLIFNYGRKEVSNFLTANALFWLKKYHVDGLRVDAVSSMVYLDYGKQGGEWVLNESGGNHNLQAVDFLRRLNGKVGEAYPGVIMIAEESTSWYGVSKPASKGGLGFDFKWNMGWTNDFLEYVSLDPVHRKHHHNKMTFGMMYAYSENFILALSHDEVVHGKKALIDKMPGDLWRKCANLRVMATFMYGHPGKKLLFMGGEFGQFIEWDEKRPLDWFLLEYEHHEKIHLFMRDVNLLYKREEALWSNDYCASGFEWIDPDDKDRSIFSFIRRGADEKDILIVVCNFTPVVYSEHRVGIPFECDFIEILNSDCEKYGGSGVTNEGVLKCEKVLSNGKEISVGLKLPPLGAAVLKPCKK